MEYDDIPPVEAGMNIIVISCSSTESMNSCIRLVYTKYLNTNIWVNSIGSFSADRYNNAQDLFSRLLTLSCLAFHFWDIPVGKQFRPRSDAAECGV